MANIEFPIIKNPKDAMRRTTLRSATGRAENKDGPEYKKPTLPKLAFLENTEDE